MYKNDLRLPCKNLAPLNFVHQCYVKHTSRELAKLTVCDTSCFQGIHASFHVRLRRSGITNIPNNFVQGGEEHINYLLTESDVFMAKSCRNVKVNTARLRFEIFL